MSQVTDLESVRRNHVFRDDTVRVFTLAYQIPQCKLLRDFLDLHRLPWQAPMMVGSIPKEELPGLVSAMQMLHEKISMKERELCEKYGVREPDDLPHEQRVFFDKTLRAFIVQEDHYP